MATTDYDKTFQAAYDMLNDQQRAAVHDIDGPVMTLAGPGTGKTQLLAVRIGHILKTTDTAAREVLALTFTEAGAFNMRQRLRSFIGPAANEVTISTFHSFCSQVIVENLEAFGEYRDLQPLSELESVAVLRRMIDEASNDHPLKRLKSSPYYNIPKMKDLFATMKRERWTEKDLREAVDALEQRALLHESFIAKRKSKCKKDPNHSYQKGETRLDKVEEYIHTFDDMLTVASDINRYNSILKKMDRYDYGDMIGWVLRAFEDNEELLAKYQEQYQYILVDEYQDTNRSQNQLVALLASYWERPNVFVVGDDDQSIYRFQGADVTNIKAFVKDYTPNIHVLTRNYRSVQPILDKASLLISNNKGSISKDLAIDKPLIASHPDKVVYQENPTKPAVSLHTYSNTTQEEAGIIHRIQQLHADGIPYSEIGILYTKHAVAESMIRYMTQIGIPIDVKKKVNVLEEIDVIRLIRLLTYIHEEYTENDSGEYLLFDILHYDFFGLEPRDIGKVSLHCRYQVVDGEPSKKSWRDVIASASELSEIGVDNSDQILEVSRLLESWIAAIPNHTLQVLYEKVITESHLLFQILQSGDTSYRLQVVNTLFDFIKEESVKKPQLGITELLTMLNQMQEEKISLPVVKISSARDAVQFMTVHGSKGLEFDHVFLIGTTETMWERKRGNNFVFKYPQRELPPRDTTAPDIQTEELRRLFFVAITRAADHFYISYAAKNNSDKDQMPSTFVTELKLEDSAVFVESVSDNVVNAYQAELLRYQQAMPQLIDHDLIDRVLERFVLSSTSLNKYLRCPTAFYYEDILRVPSARSMYIGYGNAVHYALEMYFMEMRNNDMQTPSVEQLLRLYEGGLVRFASHFTTEEMARLLEHGRESLTAYYETYHGRWSGMVDVRPEYKVKQTEHAGVLIKGTIDKVEIYQDRYIMVDYKTGSTKTASKKLRPPKDADDLGGDYWRQVVFYKLLLLNDRNLTKKVEKGVMDFVDRDKSSGKYTRKEYTITPEDIATVTDQIKQTHAAISEHKFEDGCKEEDCKWCSFVANNQAEALLQATAVDEDDARQQIEL